MPKLQLTSIPPLKTELNSEIQIKLNSKTKPIGSLGALEEIACQIAMIQNTLTPKLTEPILTLFVADHGITEEGVSAYPKEVTWQMVLNFLRGGACSNVFAKVSNIQIEVVDAGVDHFWDQTFPSLHLKKINNGTRNFKIEPAMTILEAEASIEQGIDFINGEIFKKSTIVLFGEMGIGNTSSASMILSCITEIYLKDLVGKGTGVSEEGLSHKLDILEKSKARGGAPTDPIHILSEYGGFEIAMMAGAMYQAAVLGKVILVDGFIATAAFAIANQLSSLVKDYCIFAHLSDEAGHKLILNHYQVKPLLAMNLRLGEGTGALAAYPLLVMAVDFFNEMASFNDASVSVKL